MPTVLEKPDESISEAPNVVTLPPDRISGRLRAAILVSVVVNVVVWTLAAQGIRRHSLTPPAPIEVTRLIVTPPPKIEKKKPPVKKPPTKKPPPKPKAVVPKPKPPPKAAPRRVPRVTPAPRPAPTRRAAPQAHNRVLTAPKTSAPTPHTALPGGNAPVGRPTERQAPGNARVNPPTPTPAPTPEPAPPPKPTPPAPEPPPKPSGPTRDAEPGNQVKPDIPDELKSGDFKSFVRVSVEIDADGSATPTLRTSSGNAEIDRRVLDALKRWKWKPALENGQPIKSVQRFRFEFEVE